LYPLLLFLNSALALYEGPEINEENDTNPISELYHETNPAITGEVIANMSYILKNYIFLEILQNPPFPYSDYKVNLIDELQKINTTQRRKPYHYLMTLIWISWEENSVSSLKIKALVIIVCVSHLNSTWIMKIMTTILKLNCSLKNIQYVLDIIMNPW